MLDYLNSCASAIISIFGSFLNDLFGDFFAQFILMICVVVVIGFPFMVFRWFYLLFTEGLDV